MYIIVDFVKRSVLTIVDEIWRYRNDRYYYYDTTLLSQRAEMD